MNLRSVFQRLFLSVVLASAVATVLPAMRLAGAADVPATGNADYLSWPHDGSDLRPDPRIRYGILPNGMRFAIMKNARPAGSAAFYLRIAAGSMQEADDERGYAHLLEHMAFQGSRNVSPGEMVKSLQRLGLSFGGDTNAQTSIEQTIYTFWIPSLRPDATERVLFLLREIADRLTLSPEALTTERGVVLAEETAGDTPFSRSGDKWQASLFDGMRYVDRDPIGKRDAITQATSERLRAYYQRYYRPERAILVVTGAIDPDDIEKRIRGLFADWSQPGEPGVDPDRGAPTPHRLRADWYADPHVDELVSVSWLAPKDVGPRSAARFRRDMVRQLGISIMNNRLARISDAQTSPFVSAGGGWFSIRHLPVVASLSVSPKPGQWAGSMVAAGRELQRILRYGVLQSELDVRLKALRSSYEDVVKNADLRDTTALANTIVNSIGARSIPMDPVDAARRANDILDSVTIEEVNAAVRDLFKGDPTQIFLSGPKPVDGGEAEILRTWASVAQEKIDPPQPLVAQSFPYTDFGSAGRVVSRETLADPAATKIVFANGVRLNVMTTAFEKDRVMTRVRVPGGYLDFRSSDYIADDVYSSTWTEGGLGQMTARGIRDAIPGQRVGWAAGISEDSYTLLGFSSQKDLLTASRILAAYMTDPAFRPEALEAAKLSNRQSSRARRVTAGSAMTELLGGMLHSGDRRWIIVPDTVVSAMTTDEVRRRILPALTSRPIEISMVGDVTVEQAIEAVGSTFGALATRDATYTEPKGARDVHFPARAGMVTGQHDGRADQAAIYLAWPGPEFFRDTQTFRAAELLGQIINDEITDSLRSKGKTYAPGAFVSASIAFPRVAWFGVYVEAAPQDIDDVKAVVDGVIGRLKSGLVTDDMIKRARDPILAGIDSYKSSNWYWMGVLERLQTDPRRLAAEKSLVSDFQSITREQLTLLAQTYLQAERRQEIRIVPGAAVPVAKAPSSGTPVVSASGSGQQ